jgi:hypothetical protein
VREEEGEPYGELETSFSSTISTLTIMCSSSVMFWLAVTQLVKSLRASDVTSS